MRESPESSAIQVDRGWCGVTAAAWGAAPAAGRETRSNADADQQVNSEPAAIIPETLAAVIPGGDACGYLSRVRDRFRP
jgi:hypothetical protein